MKVRTLVLCDDQWHPAATVRRGLKSLSAHGFEYDFLTDGHSWSPALLGEFPLIVVAKANHVSAKNLQPWLAANTQASFGNFVRAGGGLLLVHGGICYKDFPEFRAGIGGAFMSHPEPCAVTFEPKPDHELTRGVKLFTEIDEQYVITLDAADADVFLHTRSAHGVQPAGWTRTDGAGRVCALTPGHYAAVWQHPEFQRLLLNALHWTAKLN